MTTGHSDRCIRLRVQAVTPSEDGRRGPTAGDPLERALLDGRQEPFVQGRPQCRLGLLFGDDGAVDGADRRVGQGAARAQELLAQIRASEGMNDSAACRAGDRPCAL
ncbi:hypothetical protein [Cellulomonas sp.]|uniref:hypothetical protein n=1 Tax=Cellulomonas sp. TaxID=40001 RepID=UPI002811BE99|nr:hypothetical protein [Cellulomonas sp.]